MSGLSNHLAQTRKPQCVAVHKTMQSSATPAGPGVSPASTTPLDASIPPPDVDMDDTHPVPFEGDFFGDYDPSFFDDDDKDDDYIPPSSSLPSDSEFSEDEAGLLTAEQLGWEPPPPPTTSPASSSSLPPQSEPPQGPAIPSAAERAAADRTAQRKTHVVRFPVATAGAPIPGSDAATTANHAYLSWLSGSSTSKSSNPYAPFNSRTDWEVARWGKLRGAGSTAFTDLLAIEGVSLVFVLGLCAIVQELTPE